MLFGKKILLVISGGIAAYKSLELIRLMKKQGASVRCIITHGGQHFVTPLSVAALTEQEIYTDLWSLKDETEMGHIRLSREADLIVVAPASANLIAQMAYGLAEDLASTTLLASNRPIVIAPAMNPMMWQNQATQENIATLKKRGIATIGPACGDMACGENGEGRMEEPQVILENIVHFFENDKPLAGLKAVVTSGPTFEPIDPVRFIGNRSSGKQGHAIAQALSDAGASVIVIKGPVSIPDPKGVHVDGVETANEMLETCLTHLPCDIFIGAAAVSDWRISNQQNHKIKKDKNGNVPALDLIENQDIVKTIANHDQRPELVIAFAAETDDLIQNAQKKLQKKNCNWIIANQVGNDKAFGKASNKVTIIKPNEQIEMDEAPKEIIARDIVQEIIHYFDHNSKKEAAE